ncbi:MAG: DUF3307 domain-containing protein [Verrucomicrobiales bacterium]|nr:DUF3307 domain-containing protein [Verrucomicrobiales bacterium]
MLETFTSPLPPVTGFGSALALLFALIIGHAFADFPLQGDFLSRGKNRHTEPPKLADGKSSPGDLWVYLMTAHCLIHAGFVWVLTGSIFFGVAELILHWTIDALKCEGKTSFAVDQWLHVLCKVVFVGLLWATSAT